jgi:hypothetical protein
MINIKNAQLDPYRGFHYFHEEVNIYLKVGLSAALLLVQHTADPKESDKLHDLIKLTHPSWNTPPVRDMSIDLQRRTYASISSFALVAIFSAFDDLLVGTEAELDRFYSRGVTRPQTQAEAKSQASKNGSSTKNKQDEDEDEEDNNEERLRAFYEKNGWDIKPIEPYLIVVRYFRLCRNCIAHRNGRASRALVDLSRDVALHERTSGELDKSSNGLKDYSINDLIFVDPTHAIHCSHLLRKIAQDTNTRLLSTLGLDGFIRSVAHHTMFGEHIIDSDAYKSPEAVFNRALTYRYKAKVSNNVEGIKELQRLDLWKRYNEVFKKKYNT